MGRFCRLVPRKFFGDWELDVVRMAKRRRKKMKQSREEREKECLGGLMGKRRKEKGHA